MNIICKSNTHVTIKLTWAAEGHCTAKILICQNLFSDCVTETFFARNILSLNQACCAFDLFKINMLITEDQLPCITWHDSLVRRNYL